MKPWRAPGRGDRRFARHRLPGQRRAAALLEVVLALSILLVAMSIIGAAFRNGLFHVEHAERMNQATLMTDRLLTALDLGMVAPTEREQTGFFTEETIPGMSWSVEAQPIETVPGLFHIRVSIFMGDPEGSEDQKQHLMTTYVLRAEPRNVNLETDFGIPAEQLELLTDAIPGGKEMLDPANFNPRSIAQLDLDTLREMLPMILQALGVALNPGQMEDVLQAAQKGDLSGLQGIAGQAGAGLPPAGGQPQAQPLPFAPKDQQQPPQGQTPRNRRQR